VKLWLLLQHSPYAKRNEHMTGKIYVPQMLEDVAYTKKQYSDEEAHIMVMNILWRDSTSSCITRDTLMNDFDLVPFVRTNFNLQLPG
jgi:hypothetical protein